ncbi:unnamed protein product [Cunninghamella blakesleeana]
MSGIENNLPVDHQINDKIAPLAVGGQIIGTGIFSNPALILQNTGSGGMVLILWVIGALTAISGLVVYMELGTMLKSDYRVAEKEYLAYTYPNPKQLTAFVFMIMVGVISGSSSLAQGSTVFGSNIVFVISKDSDGWQARGFGAFCLTFWVLVNIFSIKGAIRFNNFFTVLKITLLLLLICVGFAGLSGRLPNQPNLKENFSFHGTINNAGSYAIAIYYVIFSYGGYNCLQRITDELNDPIKNLPRCGVASVAFTTVLYLLANVAYLAVLPLEEISNSNLTVAANLFSKAFGGVFGTKVLPIFVGLSSFGFVGVVTYSGSRVILEFARQGHLPFDSFFSKLHPTLHTPVPALLLLYVFSLIFLLAPPPGTAFEFIMTFSGYVDYFFGALCVIAILILRRREPLLERPFKAPIPLVLFNLVVCAFALIFVFIPPTKAPSAYPYWVPYFISIIVTLASVILWYFKMVKNDGLGQSYNNKIRKEGQIELYKDIYKDYQDSVSNPLSVNLSTNESTYSKNINGDKKIKDTTIQIKQIDYE